MSDFRIASEKHAYQLLRREIKLAMKLARRQKTKYPDQTLRFLLYNLQDALLVGPGRKAKYRTFCGEIKSLMITEWES